VTNILTDDEAKVIEVLVEAWNAFCLLPVEHPDDAGEVRRAIHAAQAKVWARPTRRNYRL